MPFPSPSPPLIFNPTPPPLGLTFALGTPSRCAKRRNFVIPPLPSGLEEEEQPEHRGALGPGIQQMLPTWFCPSGSFSSAPLAAQKHWEPKAMLCSAALRGSRMRFVLMALERWGWCWNKKKKPKTSRFFFCLQEKERKKINLFFWFFFLDKKQNYCKMCSDELVPSVLVKPMRNWASPFFSPLITSQ